MAEIGVGSVTERVTERRSANRTRTDTVRPGRDLARSRLPTLSARWRSVGRKIWNTVLVIEHNLEVIKTADWIIDLGPEGGDKGGHIVATGTPEDVALCEASYTGQYLRPYLARRPERRRRAG